MLKRIDHIGVIVDDLEEARRLLEGTLGLAHERDVEMSQRSAAFFRCGDVEIEVIEVRDPDERQRRLGEAPARIEHIAIEVDNLDHAFSALEALGVRAESSPFQVGANISIRTQASSTDGVIYQLIQKG
jgi:methylmalonyl-CoA/ethylmalonyl-CoA epimerase